VAIASPRSGVGADLAYLLLNGRWRTVTLPLPIVGRTDAVNLIDVATLPGGGFAITGQVSRGDEGFPSDPFILTSVDGLTWDLDEPSLDAESDQVWHTLGSAAGGDRVVAIAAHLLGPRGAARGLDTDVVHWSTDGRAWATAALPSPRRTAPAIEDMVVTDDGHVIAVGALV
jgi:hypothetical protein